MADSHDPVLKYLIDKAKENHWIHKLILFGSRARGDHHERSDYDIAVMTSENESLPTWFLR